VFWAINEYGTFFVKMYFGASLEGLCLPLPLGYAYQGRSDGVDIGIYTPKISPSKLFMG